MSRGRVDGDEGRAEEFLVVANGIKRSHDRVHAAVNRIDRHVDRRVETAFDFFFRSPFGTEESVAVALPHGFIKTPFDDFGFNGNVIGEVGVTSFFSLKERLEIASHLSQHRLLGVTLHSGVECGVNLQTVGVDVIV